MDAVATLHEIPLDRLVLSPANARKTPASAADDAEMKASIAAHGLAEGVRLPYHLLKLAEDYA